MTINIDDWVLQALAQVSRQFRWGYARSMQKQWIMFAVAALGLVVAARRFLAAGRAVDLWK